MANGIYEFDAAIIVTLGVRLVVVGNNAKYLYDVEDSGDLYGIPVFLAEPEQTQQNFVIPSIVIRRNDVIPSGQRKHFGGSINSAIAYNQRIVQDIPEPFDLNYDVQCFGRYKKHANKIFQKLLKVYPPYGKIKIIESGVTVATYSSYTESISRLTEIPTMTEKFEGWTMTVRVEAELDLSSELTVDIVRTRVIEMENMNG